MKLFLALLVGLTLGATCIGNESLCGSNGNCISPGICNCDLGFGGDTCSEKVGEDINYADGTISGVDLFWIVFMNIIFFICCAPCCCIMCFYGPRAIQGVGWLKGLKRGEGGLFGKQNKKSDNSHELSQ
jgi:hypothetical protein